MAEDKFYIRKVTETRTYFEVLKTWKEPQNSHFSDVGTDSYTRREIGKPEVKVVDEVRQMTEAEVVLFGERFR